MQVVGDYWTREPHSPQAPPKLCKLWKGCDIVDVGTITQLIGSLGFPICACLVLFYQNSKIEERHKEEMDKLSDALNNNTLVLTQLLERLK